MEKALKATWENGEPLLRLNQSCALGVPLGPGSDGDETAVGHPHAALSRWGVLTGVAGKHRQETSQERKKGRVALAAGCWQGAKAGETPPFAFWRLAPWVPVARVTEGTVVTEITEVTSSPASPLAAAR